MWHNRHRIAAWVALVVLAFARPARAHDAGLSRGEYAAVGATVTATLTFARHDVAYAVRHDLDDLGAAKPAIETTFAKGLKVRGDELACSTALVEAAPFESDAVRIVVHAKCPKSPHVIAIDADFLGALPFGHQHLARPQGGSVDLALTLSKRTFELTPSEPPREAPSFLAIGFRHILTGFDHLAFLLALVIAAGAARELLLVVTAFTVGHSISLALATLGWVVPSARIVEPAIALSIVYVAVENLSSSSKRRRWLLTLPFGFVHGFGFAGTLRELSLPRAELPRALALFNVGVEAGQLAVLAVILPLVSLAQKQKWFRERGAPRVNVALAFAGVCWLVLRLIDHRG